MAVNSNNDNKLWMVEAVIIVFSIAAFGLFYECFAAVATFVIGVMLVCRIGREGLIRLLGTCKGREKL